MIIKIDLNVDELYAFHKTLQTESNFWEEKTNKLFPFAKIKSSKLNDHGLTSTGKPVISYSITVEIDEYFKPTSEQTLTPLSIVTNIFNAIGRFPAN